MSSADVYRALVCSGALLLSANALAQSATAEVVKGSSGNLRAAAGDVELRAKVVEFDRTHRVATLRRANGELVTLDIPEEVKNFDAIQVGDDVFLRYAAAAVVDIQPGTKSGIRERVVSTAVATGASGTMPGVAARRTVDVLAVIQSLDSKNRKATLRGAKRTVTVDVPANVDMKKLKVGDEVRASVIESAVLSVERAPAKNPAAKK